MADIEDSAREGGGGGMAIAIDCHALEAGGRGNKGRHAVLLLLRSCLQVDVLRGQVGASFAAS